MALRIGITLGDPAGIGPEIVRAALASGKLPPDVEYRVVGESGNTVPGKPTSDSARTALAAMEQAASLARLGHIEAIVTGPIHKARMSEIGFAFPGQTEFFADRAGASNYAMLLFAGAITVALVTTHIPLSEVPRRLKRSEIVRVGKLLVDYLSRPDHARPRIAVAGLNPHAGESGKIGREEIEIIAPAIDDLRREVQAADFDGPISPDTLFYHLAQGRWDAALCMYHDQGLIPLKLHGFEQGVNVTLGLPFPRTSPDHGTAFEIAGKNIARSESMIAAISCAVELAKK
jgi:4-hydroxythreonine-4-phosphate dehydrogenase